jgi:hypothetical protein
MIETVVTSEHLDAFMPRLSFLDRRETEILSENFGLTNDAKFLIEASLAHSYYSRVLLDVSGQPLAIYGCQEMPGRDGRMFGCPWLQSADATYFSQTDTARLVKGLKKSVEDWHQNHDRLEGFSWAGATHHHKLLKLLGFEISEELHEWDGKPIAPVVAFCRNLENIRTGEKYYVC